MDTTGLWADTLKQLKIHPQVAGIYPQYLHGSTAELRGSALVVTVKPQAAAWLTRLSGLIGRVVAEVYGRPLAVEFVASTEAPSSLSPVGAATPTPRPTLINGLADVIFHHGDIVGYSAHSHYLSQFVRAYIGTLPFDVWDCIRSMGKDATLTWTAPVEITGIELARRVGCHEHRITGVKRSCFTFDQAFLSTGEIIPCCGKHQGARLAATKPTAEWPAGRPVCSYRTHGALKLLEAEGWLVYRRLGKQTKSVRYEVQIFQHLPLLTPLQANRLPPALRPKHREWIYGILKHKGLSVEMWERSEAYTYFALVADKGLILNGLQLPLPKKGVLSAVAQNNDLLCAVAHNHIFFDSNVSANGTNDRAIEPALGANVPDTGI